MNLYERLKPEYRKALDSNSEKYPEVSKTIIEGLKKEKYAHNLPLGVADDYSFTVLGRIDICVLDVYKCFEDVK